MIGLDFSVGLRADSIKCEYIMIYSAVRIRLIGDKLYCGLNARRSALIAASSVAHASVSMHPCVRVPTVEWSHHDYHMFRLVSRQAGFCVRFCNKMLTFPYLIVFFSHLSKSAFIVHSPAHC